MRRGRLRRRKLSFFETQIKPHKSGQLENHGVRVDMSWQSEDALRRILASDDGEARKQAARLELEARNLPL